MNKQQVPPGHPGEMVMTYVEIDDAGTPTGNRLSFTGVELRPLGYSDLVNQRQGNTITIPLNWQNAKVVESTVSGIDIDSVASGNATLRSVYSSRTIGLVKGGWLPSGLGLQGGMVILPDRCTVSELNRRFRNGTKTKEEDRDFLDMFAERGVRINPLLFALEGNLRAEPSAEVVEQQLEEAYAKIRAALPLAKLEPEGKSGLQGIVGIIQDTSLALERKQEFLMHLAPKLQAPVSAQRKAPLWDEILRASDKFGVPRQSLVVLAALSSVAVPNGRSPAKRVLKLTANYTVADAYNALADLRSLELLMCLFALYPSEKLMLCTDDRNLALFWAGIQAYEFTWCNGFASFKMSPVDALLPDVSPAQMSSFLD
ncbi:hypothetical protein PS726_05082 [Pseudomonas fluorescens]|uniref:hypothetical protein n=1 Tax=Pseudomonas fluorescens TaxID=294 RepID=UPI001259756D|nr:hypothetical protein [Pseudomonas fluorescens]VVO32211.1 hypothetical protein PS726_05082 [Pseudomonas fluorescens]